MSRIARQYSESGLYHIIFRGLNKQDIFNDTSDFFRLKTTIVKFKQEMNFEVYAYCFMSNHVHIMIKEKQIGEISLIMKRILTGYAMYFNKKYDRTGPLFESRYKSNPIEIDDYFLAVVRYIHQNPLKACMVKEVGEYTWSSYPEYARDINGLADKSFVLEMLDEEDFVIFHQTEETEVFEIDGKRKPDTDSIKRDIIIKYSVQPSEIKNMSRDERDNILKELNMQYSLRQLEKITGIPRTAIKNFLHI